VDRAAHAPAPREGRRRFLLAIVPAGIVLAGSLALPWLAGGPVVVAVAQERRYTVAFANLTEEPGATLEGTGFTGREVRESFALAARRYPIDLVFYDNHRDPKNALANVEDAVKRKVDLYIQYLDDPATNVKIGQSLRGAGIRALAINTPVPDAPLYTMDNRAAGRIAGEALSEYGAKSWRGTPTLGIVVGNLRAQELRIPERAQGASEGLKRHLPALKITMLETQGNPAQVAPLLAKVLAANPATKVLVAAMDDASALAAKSALDSAGRLADGAIVGQGVDRSVHGGINDRKEIDPSNRGSIVLGSVAFYLDRYGYEVLPIAMRMLRGETVAPRTVTAHRLITAANVFIEYPPYDMN
jgi:ABC-type sugar transport system substrate-binding protein